MFSSIEGFDGPEVLRVSFKSILFIRKVSKFPKADSLLNSEYISYLS